MLPGIPQLIVWHMDGEIIIKHILTQLLTNTGHQSYLRYGPNFQSKKSRFHRPFL